MLIWYLTLCTDTCDFEESNICGYTQDKTDDFDWTRDNGGTTTRGTGPSADHTYGTKEGTFTLYTRSPLSCCKLRIFKKFPSNFDSSTGAF